VLILGIIVYFSVNSGIKFDSGDKTSGKMVKGCVSPNSDNEVSSSKLNGSEWTVMTWFKHVDDPDDLTEEHTIMSKSGSPKFKLDEIRFLDTFQTIVKFQWHSPDGVKYETKDNAFSNKTIDAKNRTVDQWKHYTWVHKDNKNKFYEDSRLFYELIDPEMFVVNEGPVKFSDKARYSKVCNRALSKDSIKDIFKSELNNFSKKEKMKNNLVRVGRQ